MSSILSASSSTHILTWSSRSAPCPSKSKRRPGVGDQDIGAPREMADLRSDVDATTHHLAVQFESRTVATDAISDLRCELSGGSQN